MYSLYVLATASRWLLSDKEIRLQTRAAALAAETGLLVPAERRRGIEPVEGVRPDHAGPHLLGGPQNPGALLRPDPGRQPVRRVVRLADRFLWRAEGQHR